MRVLYVSAFGGAGMGRAAQRYYPLEVARRGVEVAMVGESIAEELSGKVATFAMGARWQHLRRRLVALRQVVRSVRPDIVHVFRHIDCELYPLVCGAGTRATWLVDARTPILATGLSRLPSLLSGRACGVVYGACAAHAETVGRTLFGRRDVKVLPPGYDVQMFVPALPGTERLDKSLLRLVYTGSLEARRRIVGALSALVTAATNQPAGARHRFAIDIYGEGADDAAIKALADRAPEVIRHAGFIPQGELAARLSDYDVGLSLILNPVYREAPPLKTIEYLASGLPVIASDTPGNRLYIEHGVNGWLIDSRPESLAALVLRLCQEGVPEVMKARATQSVRGQDWGALVDDRLLPLYQSLVRPKHGNTRG